MLKNALIIAGTGCTPARAAAWLPALSGACQRYDIQSPRQIAAFLGQIGVESAGLTAVVENLNYSAEGLLKVFPKYFTPEQAEVYARQPQRIANRVYANRMGNGDEASGDGWKNRGRGLIQITGHDNLVACGKALGVDLVNDPDQLLASEYAALSAAWYFAANGCLPLAEAGDIRGVTRKINRALLMLERRQSLYAAALPLVSV